MHPLLRLIPVVLLSVFAAPAPAPADWTTYQGATSRAGVVADAPPFAGFQRRFSQRVDGEIYTQPLISGGRVYVATENNSVYAFTTSGALVFRRHLGAPVPGKDLPCGNINPSGITGTPVLAGGRLYVVAFLRAGPHHILFGLDPVSGRVVSRQRVDPANRITQQQRGALLADHGRIYIPFGGLFGDCGTYHGVVVSAAIVGGRTSIFSDPARKAGIWTPGGLSEEPDGNLLVATGNGSGPGNLGYINSVMRLSPGLVRQAYWAPSDWSSLSRSDTDIGSLEPLPLPDGRVFQAGKDGNGYLLPRGLGHIGGELFKAGICDSALGAPALSGSMVLVPCASSLVALRLSGDRFSVAWRRSGNASTPVIAGSAAIYISGDQLIAVGLAGGRQLASVNVGGGANSFPAPAGSGDLVVAPAGRSVIGFGGG
ncbi:MAG TPA: PQQ-binding-like beta-propeller repeat protein [Solirubrobacteraceae bacterium]|nr:PQQ-binding-like beta-propeller repeat protein [Solirubrobacteraceae bacterium]